MYDSRRKLDTSAVVNRRLLRMLRKYIFNLNEQCLEFLNIEQIFYLSLSGKQSRQFIIVFIAWDFKILIYVSAVMPCFRNRSVWSDCNINALTSKISACSIERFIIKQNHEHVRCSILMIWGRATNCLRNLFIKVEAIILEKDIDLFSPYSWPVYVLKYIYSILPHPTNLLNS